MMLSLLCGSPAGGWFPPPPPNPPPPDVTHLFLDTDRVSWTDYTIPSDFAGFLREAVFTAGALWGAPTNIRVGVLSHYFYELLADIPTGAVELLVKAVDDSDNLSVNPGRISLNTIVVPPPPPDPYGFGNDWTVNWIAYFGSSNARIIQETNAIVADAGSGTGDADASIVMVCRTPPPAIPYTFQFFYTWIDGQTTTTDKGIFTQWIYAIQGVLPAAPVDPTTWLSTVYDDPAYLPHLSDEVITAKAKGLRASFNTQNSITPSLSNEIRARRWNGNATVTVLTADQTDVSYDFVTTREYTITVAAANSTVAFTKAATGIHSRMVSFTDPLVGSMAGKNFGLKFSAGRKCRVRALALTSGGGGGGVGGNENDGFWPEPVPLSSVNASDIVNLTSASNFVISGQPGKHYVVTQNCAGKAIVISGNGNIDHPIILRGNSDSPNPDDWPELSNCHGDLFNGQRIYIYKLRMNNPAFTPTNGSWCRICRTQNYNRSGGTNAPAYLFGGNIDHSRFDRNWAGRRRNSGGGVIDDWKATLVMFKLVAVGGKVPTFMEVNRNQFVETMTDSAHVGGGAGGTILLRAGTNEEADFLQSMPSFISNMFKDLENDYSVIEVKAGHWLAQGNIFWATKASCGSMFLRARHGKFATIKRNLWWIQTGLGGNYGGIQTRDADGICVENGAYQSDGTPSSRAAVQLNDGNKEADGWPGNRVGGSGSNWPNTKRWTVAGNDMDVIAGGFTSGSYPVQDCLITPASSSRSDRNRSYSPRRAAGTRTDVTSYQYRAPLPMPPDPNKYGVAAPMLS
jgi:hypothetical protein